MTFDATTAYANEHALYQDVDDATFTRRDPAQGAGTPLAVKISWLEHEPKNTPTGQRLGLSPKESALVLWGAVSGLAVVGTGDTVTVDSTVYTINRVDTRRWGYWLCEVTQQEVNS